MGTRIVDAWNGWYLNGLAQEGGVRAIRFKITAIADRTHQLAVFRYILDHRKQGAATWSFRDRA